MTNAIEEGEVAVDEEKGTEDTTEAVATDVEPQVTADVDDEEVEAHVWRAQS